MKWWKDQDVYKRQELEVVAIRRSVVPGTHTVTYESDVDALSITHMAKSRRAVSYTHLDVYKRQAMPAPTFSSQKVQPQMVQPWSPIRPTHTSYTDASISIRQLPIRLEP